MTPELDSLFKAAIPAPKPLLEITSFDHMVTYVRDGYAEDPRNTKGHLSTMSVFRRLYPVVDLDYEIDPKANQPVFDSNANKFTATIRLNWFVDQYDQLFKQCLVSPADFADQFCESDVTVEIPIAPVKLPDKFTNTPGQFCDSERNTLSFNLNHELRLDEGYSDRQVFHDGAGNTLAFAFSLDEYVLNISVWPSLVSADFQYNGQFSFEAPCMIQVKAVTATTFNDLLTAAVDWLNRPTTDSFISDCTNTVARSLIAHDALEDAKASKIRDSDYYGAYQYFTRKDFETVVFEVLV